MQQGALGAETMRTRTLSDAQRATKSRGNATGGPQATQAEIIVDVFAALEHRLAAIEDILMELRFSLVRQLPRWVRDRCARTLQ